MTADVDICNRALQNMGTRSTIAALTEQSAEAVACNLRYPSVRDRLLRSAPWGFAKAVATLGLLKAAPGTPELPSSSAQVWSTAFPAPPWLYAYQYPTDCMRFRRVLAGNYYAGTPIPTYSPVTVFAPMSGDTEGPAVRWEQATDVDASGNTIRVINCNVDQAIGVYTRQLLTPDSWDVDFQAALEYALAAELAVALSGDKTLRKQNIEEAARLIGEARLLDAREAFATQNTMPDWLRVRNIGSSYNWSPGMAPMDPGYDSIALGGIII